MYIFRHMTEPYVALTDYGLSLECLAFLFLLAPVQLFRGERFWFFVFFASLFGVVSSVTLKLVPRKKIQLAVRTTDVLMEAFNDRIKNGFLNGDFQFAVDLESEDFLHRGRTCNKTARKKKALLPLATPGALLFGESSIRDILSWPQQLVGPSGD